MSPRLLAVLALPVILALATGLAIAFGGPSEPAPMASINNPFKGLDYSGMPASRQFLARDQTRLSFRAYPAAQGDVLGSVVLVHGSSANSSSMHRLAQAFSLAGYEAYALDIRGHGDSGPKGKLAYVGQLEDDLQDFMLSVKPTGPATLVGFSSGGGLALRFAGSPRQQLFSGYLLLSPFLSQDAPTYRKNSGGWVSVGVPRLVAIAVLNKLGVRAFNDLPVTRFALNEEAKRMLTPEYSYALAQNFRPQPDYQANIRAANQALRVVAGEDDEAFYADQFANAFAAQGKQGVVRLLPGIDHIQLTLDQAAVDAAVDAVGSMGKPGSPGS